MGVLFGVIIKALIEKKKLNAEATNTNIKSLLEIDQRMNERMAKLEERVANLEQENYKLKSDKLKFVNKINLVIISNINIINFLFQKYITIHVISSTIESWHFH